MTIGGGRGLLRAGGGTSCSTAGTGVELFGRTKVAVTTVRLEPIASLSDMDRSGRGRDFGRGLLDSPSFFNGMVYSTG